MPGAGPWHYVNVSITEARYDSRYYPQGGCVVSKVEDFRRILMDSGAERPQKQRALKFLIHFIQDLHCPVHVGDNGDRGGNDLQLRFFDIGTNLHRIWDSQLIERAGLTEGEWTDRLNAIAAQDLAEAWSMGTVEDWATENLEAANAAYRIPGTYLILKPGTKLGEDYLKTVLPIAERQLAKSGVRLAFVLNKIFGR
jgi:hypothetical protein